MELYADIVRQAEWTGETLHASIPAAWTQGRTVFGGLTAGLALYATNKNIEKDRPLRSMLTAFVGPVSAGEVAISAHVLRKGRNVTHVQATVSQHESVCCTVLACYGRDRQSPVSVTPPAAPDLPAPQELPDVPFVPGLSPEFSRFLEYRWTAESIPFIGRGNGTAEGYIRMRQGAAVTPDLFVLLADAWPSPALAMQRGPAPISSLTWSLEVDGIDAAQRTDHWWCVRATIESAANGYVYEDAHIWAPDGRFAARSRQTVSVYTRGSTG